MKTKAFIYSLFIGLILSIGSIQAQDYFKANLAKDGKASTIMLSYNDVLMVSYLDSIIAIEIVSNVDLDITPSVDWLELVKIEKNNVFFKTKQNEQETFRVGKIEFAERGGNIKKSLTIHQEKTNAASSIKGDRKIKVHSGSASQQQPSEEIDKSFDGDYSSMYHSPWSGTRMPVTLTYNFKDVKHIDYLIYHPRRSGGSNGNFDEIDVLYQLEGDTEFTEFNSYALGGSSSSFRIDFPEGLVNPKAVRFIVKSGTAGFVSCAEMEFYTLNEGMTSLFDIFDDAICTQLKPGVTQKQLDDILNPFVKSLAKAIYAGDYDKEFRVNEFEAFPTLSETSNWMRTSDYNRYENPTGIYFEKDDEIIIFVDNPGDDNVALLIQNQNPVEGGGSTYFLNNGINKIKANNKGQGYLSYYTTNWKTAPNVKVHFAFGNVTGYFDLEKYKLEDGSYDLSTANTEFSRIVSKAKSPMFDVISKRHHACYPTQGFRTKNVGTGANFALAYDSIVYYSHEIMGLIKYNKEPKNRQFSRSVESGMFADGIGAGIPNWTSYGYIDVKNMDWWGIAHELGHVNQVRPNMKWLSTTEVTNNIYSSYVQHKVGGSSWIKSLGGTAFYRLEDESHGGIDIMNGRGGRFNAYLNFGIKDGTKWLMQEGPDYYGSQPSGSPAGRNYDHFVKLAPLWQLTLYFMEAGVYPDFWADIFETARQQPTNLTEGQYQLNFMKNAIDVTGLNLAPFFEKAGLLSVYNDYLVDYTSGTMRITQAQVDELKEYASQFPALETPVLYYISIKNYEIYRDKLSLHIDDSTVGVRYNNTNKKLTVKHDRIINAVAFETFDASGKLSRITMRSFGNAANALTEVLYPAGSSRVDAIGWDGSRITIYSTPN